MEAIFGKEGVKAGFTSGNSQEAIQEAARALIKRGAEAVIAGCTEVPLCFSSVDKALRRKVEYKRCGRSLSVFYEKKR